MRGLVVSATVLSMVLAAGPALASGSGSGGGGGGFESVSGNSATQASPEQRLLDRGRSQVRKRITCKKCDYHRNLNQQTASEVAEAVRSGKFDIKEKNRSAVLFFLRQRYGV